jgi:DNA-directed RNA polymerase subunit K/omega
MNEVEKSMFARAVDFKLEKTTNAYIACRALSIRARHINGRARDAAPETKTDGHNPTVGALVDYSQDHIAVIVPQVDNP